ncbi:50S ribosomal protein L18 [bacterium]|nr:50S ribosomal protein L18 [bacterium]
MSVEKDRRVARIKRQLRARRRIFGTPERPRLCVTKSLKHMYAQIIDDRAGNTLVAASTREAGIADEKGGTGNVEAAKKVGMEVGRRAVEKGITKVVFDRAGWPYHGRVKALADGAREAGLDF